MMQLYRQSKLKFGLFAIIVSLSSGCASQRIGVADMQQYKTNCDNKKESMAFLNSVQYNKGDEIWASLQILFMGPFTPDFEKKKDIANGSARYWIQGVKEDYLARCGS